MTFSFLMKEKIYAINLVTNIIKKYTEVYKIDNNQENIDENNKEKFLEILNILLGLPIPLVSKGEAEIKYISGKFQDKYSGIFMPYSFCILYTRVGFVVTSSSYCVIFLFTLGCNLFVLNAGG